MKRLLIGHTLCVVFLAVGCSQSAPPDPDIDFQARAVPPAPTAAPVAVPVSVGQGIGWTQDQQTVAQALAFEYWLYIGAGDKIYAQVTPVTCKPALTATNTECSGKLPASKGWMPGVEHQVTLTQYNPTNGQESVRSDVLTLILTASVVTPRAVTLDVGPSIPKPPAP